MPKHYFYVVATPIGNLEDITLRALHILKEVDIVLCEDTRVTRKLLTHYDIHTKTQSYHEHSSPKAHERILEQINNGTTCALVTDAGTPCIADPGYQLLNALREQLPDVEIVSVPGPSAVTASLSVSGIDAQEFVFMGFVPHKKGRQTFFDRIAQANQTVVFYESTHRLMKTLETLQATLGHTKRIAVSSELTKLFESTTVGTPQEIIAFFTEDPKRQRGEFVIVVEKAR